MRLDPVTVIGYTCMAGVILLILAVLVWAVWKSREPRRFRGPSGLPARIRTPPPDDWDGDLSQVTPHHVNARIERLARIERRKRLK
jgi:hypothetical protein